MSTARMKVHFPQIENLKKQIYKQEIKKRPDSPRPPFIAKPKKPLPKLKYYPKIPEENKVPKP